MKTVVIDGDLVAFESASAGTRTFDWGDVKSSHVDPTHARANLRSRISTIQEATGADKVVIALSCASRRYFRHDIDPEYKAARAKLPTMPLVGELKQFLRDTYETHAGDLLEADDVMGIMATSPAWKKRLGIIILSSRDKDMRQIPGLHINHGKLEEGIVEISRYEADRWHMYQTLIGDAIDGYKGCPGIGPKKAEKILGTFTNVWPAVVAAFVAKGLTEADALKQARLARILRASDWDAKNKKPILWSPKK